MEPAYQIYLTRLKRHTPGPILACCQNGFGVEFIGFELTDHQRTATHIANERGLDAPDFVRYVRARRNMETRKMRRKTKTKQTP